MGIVLPHIFWAPSSRSSCFSLPRSPPCTPRPTLPSPTPQATTFPTPSARPSPTPPTPSPPSYTPPPPDARTTPALWCPVLTVVSLELSLPPLLPLLSPLSRRRGRRGRPLLRLRPILRLRLRPGCSTGPTATGPSATVTLPTAMLPTPTPATTATTALATTTATTAGRRGRQLLRLTLRLPLRPIPGCCTVATDCPTEGTTATATTTLPTLTSEAAATILADLSLALEDKREGSYQRKIKINSWNHVLISCFTFVQRVCQNIEIDNKKTFL